MTTTDSTAERMEVQRTIEAEPAAIFEILRDPMGHVSIDASGMLLDATGEPASAAGDTFVIHMDREALNDYPLGKYRSEEHTSELQSLMRISYAVFCLKKKNQQYHTTHIPPLTASTVHTN